ncbi:MAG TPA: hypothetical protein VGO62_19710 [Myxococcota bacterium]|jgi:hypothetical protein
MLFARRTIIGLEVLVALLAAAGGVALLSKPNGQILGFDVGMLHGTFNSFVIPGVALCAMAVLFLAAAWATHKRVVWDHLLSAVAGFVLIAWIAVQVALIGLTNFTQPVFFAVGALIFYLATLSWRQGEGPHLGMLESVEGLGTHKPSDESNMPGAHHARPRRAARVATMR